MSNVSIKTVREVNGIRAASQMAAETLIAVGEILRPGLTTEEINTFVHDDTLRRGGFPAPLNYHGFPKSVCTSINEVVCHGIPGPRALREGDIINVDVTTIFEGFFGDTSATFFIGEVSSEARHVTEVCRKALDLAIAEVREGARLGDIGAAIEGYAHAHGCSVVRAFVGHGIGRVFHEAPQVSHVGKRGTGLRLKAGMVFTIEPMINVGGYEVEVLEDKWTAVTADGSLSAQFEHTIVVTKTGAEVLTKRSRPLKNSEERVAPAGADLARPGPP
jgi:methionyl aminopeptidase